MQTLILQKMSAFGRPRLWRSARWGALVALLSWLPVHAEVAGEVEFTRGVGFAQTAGQNARVMGKGLALKEGDRLTTTEGGTAIIKLQDGTRMTVRPNSEMLIQQYRFKDAAAADNTMVMQLLKGGFRAITGLISKSSPDAARVMTKTATIGIRGTDFDARVCTTECKAESGKVLEPSRANTVQASAKLVSAQGDVSAIDGQGIRRRVVTGGSLYPGETLETGVGAWAVMAFRDDSRTTLGANTRFRVDSFVFDENSPKDGRFLVSLLRGSMRALTGLIGKANNRNVGFSTATATIGIRGTGLDMDCGAEGSCSFFTWQGAIEVTPLGQTAMQLIEAGQGLAVGLDGIRPIDAPTMEQVPRPDSVPVDTKQLFSAAPVDEGQEGLFVQVRDGHIEITTSRETLHLGRGEAGFAGNDGAVVRPVVMPQFLQFDRIPMPDSKSPMLSTVLDEGGIRPVNQCR